MSDPGADNAKASGKPTAPMGAAPRRGVASRARAYLLGASLLALVVAFALFAAGWSQYAIRERTADLSRQTAALARGQAVGSQPAGASATTRDTLFRVEAGLIGAELFVTDAAGGVQRASASGSPASLPLDRLQPGAGGISTGVLRNAAGQRVLVVAAPIDAGHRLVAVQSLTDIRQAQAGLLLIGTVALLVAAGVAYVAGGLLAERLTRPLVRLRRAAERVADGELGTQVIEEGDAETASLAHSFNRMSTRVADAYAAQKAFAGDVSHEIRTPLTSIRGFAEAMLDGTVTDPVEQRRALGVIRDEATRISEVSATLLALSELEAGSVEIASVPVDPRLLADALKGRFSATAGAAGVALEIDLPSEEGVLGDPDRVLQALSALVANAIAHTPAGGRVRVGTERAGGEVRLQVDDSGPGVPPERRDEVFGRFARLESARSVDPEGAGLGLAICQRLVELMGGRVAVSDGVLGGARFEIALPAA